VSFAAGLQAQLFIITRKNQALTGINKKAEFIGQMHFQLNLFANENFSILIGLCRYAISFFREMDPRRWRRCLLESVSRSCRWFGGRFGCAASANRIEWSIVEGEEEEAGIDAIISDNIAASPF